MIPPAYDGQTERCGKCTFYMQSSNFANSGACRRYPPHTNNDSVVGYWPLVSMDAWCGEFVARSLRSPSTEEREP